MLTLPAFAPLADPASPRSLRHANEATRAFIRCATNDAQGITRLDVVPSRKNTLCARLYVQADSSLDLALRISATLRVAFECRIRELFFLGPVGHTRFDIVPIPARVVRDLAFATHRVEVFNPSK